MSLRLGLNGGASTLAKHHPQPNRLALPFPYPEARIYAHPNNRKSTAPKALNPTSPSRTSRLPTIHPKKVGQKVQRHIVGSKMNLTSQQTPSRLDLLSLDVLARRPQC
ncbi:hypothetical protein JAAARDRAFT_40734 [Jaapia argillacea MUCL 33604]|uniref:Uncharacterized protein n=1 Tax=Jaapia argillacea MUCL 33604 TaxID=933084 RepID=A0A067PNL2_9AGAM|nr:hypothetical protein JAAARDRAFT_40734 [Jaapia argillacea MUCL 33604]